MGLYRAHSDAAMLGAVVLLSSVAGSINITSTAPLHSAAGAQAGAAVAIPDTSEREAELQLQQQQEEEGDSHGHVNAAGANGDGSGVSCGCLNKGAAKGNKIRALIWGSAARDDVSPAKGPVAASVTQTSDSGATTGAASTSLEQVAKGGLAKQGKQAQQPRVQAVATAAAAGGGGGAVRAPVVVAAGSSDENEIQSNEAEEVSERTKQGFICL